MAARSKTSAPKRASRRSSTTKPARGAGADGGALASLVAAAAFVAVTVGSLRSKPEPGALPSAADGRGGSARRGADGGRGAGGDGAGRPDGLGRGPTAVEAAPGRTRVAVRPEDESRIAALASASELPAGIAVDGKEAPAVLRRLDGWQRSHPWVAFPLGVLRKFGDDRAAYLAALVSYFGFFSLFPLLMAATSILGLVLRGHEEWGDKLTGEAVQQIPIIGQDLSIGELTGSWAAIVVGAALATWSGLKVIDAAQNALNDVWDVPVLGRPTFARRRARSVILLGVIGLALLASLASSSIAGLLPDLPGVGRFGVYGITLLFNVGVFLLAFQVLSELRHPWGELVPGSLFAAVGWFALQVPGAFYIQRTIADAGPAYGTFAGVIGLLTFFFLASQVIIIGAEINVVKARRLWPRSLLSRYGEVTEADQRVLADAAAATSRVPGQRVEVDFAHRPLDG